VISYGLTGGIGSGKTTVAKIMEAMGVPVFNADFYGRICLENKINKPIIIERWGEKFWPAQSQPNRKLIAERVFQDPEERAWLNQLIHPQVGQAFEDWKKKQSAPFAVKEAAILFESGTDRDLDGVVGVYAPLDLRIARLKVRDSLSEVEIQQRINSQWPEEKKLALCAWVIYNDDKQSVIKQVEKLVETWKEKPNKP
jgi:dephospho-CoA kinase